MENIDKDENEEEVVVSGDLGCAAMRAGAALQAAAASAAATAGSMEGMSSGRGLGARGLGVPSRDLVGRRANQVGNLGKGGAGLRSPPLGSAGLGACNA